ncbi:hypothetical protein VNO78_02433 [Psophocarpus tetragonolobus]|uniref:Uncharacterized protein n=1 Tax=Psophocarpus tetragonolobus TaxID=3891 RepID=A0AAN9TBP4_PSOTE
MYFVRTDYFLCKINPLFVCFLKPLPPLFHRLEATSFSVRYAGAFGVLTHLETQEFKTELFQKLSEDLYEFGIILMQL